MTVWTEHRQHIEEQIAEWKASLAKLEAGDLKHLERAPDGTFREITPDLIAELRRDVSGHENLLATIKKLAS